MCPRTAACPDPEAQRPPAPPGSACRPLPWALSAALLLLAGTGAACVLRWAAPRAPAAPGPGLPGLPELPELPELLPDARARLPDSPQVRCARNPFSHPGPREHPFFIQDFGGHPRETPSASRAPEGNPFSIADPEGSSLSPTGRGTPRSFLTPGEPRFSPAPLGSPPFLPKGPLEGLAPLFSAESRSSALADSRGWGTLSHQLWVRVYARVFIWSRGEGSRSAQTPGTPTFQGAAAAGGGASVHFPPFLSPQGVFAQLVARDGECPEVIPLGRTGAGVATRRRNPGTGRPPLPPSDPLPLLSESCPLTFLNLLCLPDLPMTLSGCRLFLL